MSTRYWFRAASALVLGVGLAHCADIPSCLDPAPAAEAETKTLFADDAPAQQTSMVYFFYDAQKAAQRPLIDLDKGEKKRIVDGIFVFCNWQNGDLFKATSFQFDDDTPPRGAVKVGEMPDENKLYIQYGDGKASRADVNEQMDKIPKPQAADAHKNLSLCRAKEKLRQYDNQ